MDEIIVNEGVTQGWMQVPLSPKEVGILKKLPEEGKHEFTENVHRYIGQVGDDYKVTPPDAVPAQEPAGIVIPFVLDENGSVIRGAEDAGTLGMTEEEMERVISVLKALPEINIEEVLRSSTSYSEGEKR